MPCIDNTVSTGHLTGSGKTRRCACQSLPNQCNQCSQLIHLCFSRRVSLAHPAILAIAVANIWAGSQKLTLQSLIPSQEFDSVHYVFCLTENEDYAEERVSCVAISAERSHLFCAEEWLEKRRTGSGMSCCVRESKQSSPNALICLLLVPRWIWRHSVHTASESSATGGPLRSARLAGAYLARDPSTSAPLRRSARLDSTQRGSSQVTAEYDGKLNLAT
ncbi:hypothetical protein N7451_012067 [Penicillium sp. IBT 35674x]|nr:hypothetical protein N7451_012067 [Penicillium sp. IBT 35674x]